MSGRWTGPDGWPRPYPDAVAGAIRALPGGDGLPAERVAFLAELIANAALEGAAQELPAALQSSRPQADASLTKLHDLCEQLALHLRALRRPAIDALRAEGLEASTFRMLIEEAQDAARCAYGGITAPESNPGNNPSIKANYVTDECSGVFQIVAGRVPTFTTDHMTSKVSGAWIDFLTAVFLACNVNASVESQAKRERRERKLQKSTD